VMVLLVVAAGLAEGGEVCRDVELELGGELGVDESARIDDGGDDSLLGPALTR